MKKITTLFIASIASMLVAFARQNIQLDNKTTAGLPTQKVAIKNKEYGILTDTTNYQYYVIKASGNTYGYSIFVNGHSYIWQTTIPSVTGTVGFADTAKAAQTARLVIQKMKNGEMPPTITEQELRNNKIIQ
jgi:Domain of unknown function (DUF4907)